MKTANNPSLPTRVVIIGANGMLGQALAKEFPNATGLDLPAIDIANYDSVDKVLGELKPDLVINAAAYTAVDDCEEKFELANKVNGQGPGNLAKKCKELDAVLVHYSTDYIFNGTKQDGYNEEFNEIDPINKYGESKALGEKLIKENTDKYYILRIAWLYGPDGKNFVDTMIELSAKHPELKVVNDQTGSPTYTIDVAKRTREALDQSFGIYHATNSGQATWFEFTQEIFKLKGIATPLKPCSSGEFPRPAARPEYSILLNTKLPPARDWKEALSEYLSK